MLRLLCLALVLLGFSGPVLAGQVITGPARVIDGDTLDVADVRIRLFGVDAPEGKQNCRTEQGVEWACGAWVTAQVEARFAGRSVDCVPLDIDRYGRTVARCFSGGADLAEMLVSEGLVFAYAKYSGDYLAAEAEARSSARGLWSSRVQTPEVFRLVAQKDEQPPSPGCAIKGNISSSGHIYHLPGSKWYSKTKIDTSRGERWFCSVAEAVAAGWRAPRG